MTWTPLNMTGIKAWYRRGPDQKTVAGGLVSRWINAADPGISDVSQATASQQPLYNAAEDTIRQNGSETAFLQYDPSTSIPFDLPSNPEITMAMVAKPIRDPGGGNVYFGLVEPGGDNGNLATSGGSSGWAWRFYGGNKIYGPTDYGLWKMAVWHRPGPSTFADGDFRLDGVDQTVTSSVTGPDPIDIENANFGIYNVEGLTGRADADISQLVLAETNDLDEIQKLEGYFAWTDPNRSPEDLPLNHPYRWDGTLFGAGRYWNPSDLHISGRGVYWYSARDQFDAFLTETAGLVSEIRDILGSGVDLQQAVGSDQPTLSTSVLAVRVVETDSGTDSIAALNLAESEQQDAHVICLTERISGRDDLPWVVSAAGPSAENSIGDTSFRAHGESLPAVSPPNDMALERYETLWPGGYTAYHRWGSATPYASGTVSYSSALNRTWIRISIEFTENAGDKTFFTDYIFAFGTFSTDELQLAEAYVAFTAGQEGSLSADNPYNLTGPTLYSVIIDVIAGSFRNLEVSGASSPVGSDPVYEWDFGDGTDPVFGVNPTHFYDVVGTYVVTLTIMDSVGTRSSTIIYTATNEPPTASFVGSIEGDEIEVDASSSTDDIGIVSYEWNWSDGSPNTFGRETSHEFPTPNTLYTVTLTVTDTDGATDSIAQNFTTDIAPTADADIVNEIFRTVTVDGSGSAGTNISYLWDWGDGQTSTGVTATHTYSATGAYTITLTITAVEGTDSDSIGFVAVEIGRSPRTEVVGFDLPSPVLTDAGAATEGWSSLALLMNAWLLSEPAERIWIRDFQVDIAHDSSQGTNGLQAYILYENAWRPAEETRIGVTYEVQYFSGPLPSPFVTWEEWFASEVDSLRNLFLPQFIVPIPPADGDSIAQDTRYFIVGIKITPYDRQAHRKDTSCLIGITAEGIPANGGFGETDLYDSSGKFLYRTASVINVGPVALEVGEIILCIPDQEDSDYIAISMCCRPPEVP